MAKKTREKKSPMGGGASRRGGAEAAKPKHSMSTGTIEPKAAFMETRKEAPRP